MRILKNKYLLPVCLMGLLGGYAAAEWVVPRYFHPTQDTLSSPQNFILAIGKQEGYQRQTRAGNYLSGQHAQRHKNWDKANTYIRRVIESEPDNTSLQKHAMVLSMASGNAEDAIALAKKAGDSDDTNVLSTLFIALEHFKKEEYPKAIDTMNSIDKQNVAAFIIPVLSLWADTEQNKIDVSSFEPNSFYAYHALLAGLYINKKENVLKYAQQSYDIAQTDLRDLERAADLFVQIGNKDNALEIYKSLYSKGLGSEDLLSKISGLSKGDDISNIIQIPRITSPKDGAALVFNNMAEILLRERSDDSATIFAQMALYLNPELKKSHMIIGHIFARHDRYDDAINQYKEIKPDSPLYKKARYQIADLYTEQKKNDEAISILKDLNKETEDMDAIVRIGDIYRYEENYQKAIDTYNKVIGNASDVPEELWHVAYARGMSYERLKEFEKSEQDLLKALEYRPEHPFILNYLGYSWADQGNNLNKALEMIQKATEIKPEDGYIADSLGWVYYKLYDYEAATPHLERAVELLPYDATINDHLGDVYWKVGRKMEAKFQWQRALNYSNESETELKTSIQKKLDAGGLVDESKDTSETVKQALDKQKEPAL